MMFRSMQQRETQGYSQLEKNAFLKEFFDQKTDQPIRDFLAKMTPDSFKCARQFLIKQWAHPNDIRNAVNQFIENEKSPRNTDVATLFGPHACVALNENLLNFDELHHICDRSFESKQLLSDDGIEALRQGTMSYLLAHNANYMELCRYISESGRSIIKEIMKKEGWYTQDLSENSLTLYSKFYSIYDNACERPQNQGYSL